MAHTAQRTGAHTARRSPLNQVGPRKRVHPAEDTLIALTVLFAIVGAICAFLPALHIPGAWIALAGVVSGLAAQMFSYTTAERFVTVLALGVSAVSLGMNLVHGGFS